MPDATGKKEKLCAKHVFSGSRWDFGGHRCSKKAVVQEDGKGWCKIHAPSYEKAKHERQASKWKEEAAAQSQRYRQEREREAHRDACERACLPFADPERDVPRIVEAARKCLEQFDRCTMFDACGDPFDELRAALRLVQTSGEKGE